MIWEASAEIVDGIPLLSAGDALRRPTPLLDELEQQMIETSADEAARRFCARHGCSRELYAADWKYLIARPEGTHVLEIGAGFGDDSITLCTPETSALLVPTLANARVLLRRLKEAQEGEWAIAVADSVERLPLADAAVGAVTIEEAAFAGFGVDGASIAALAAECRRVLVPGGTVFVGLPNPLHHLPGIGALRSRLQRPGPEPMNRVVKRAAARNGRGPSPRQVLRAMARAGFPAPVVYAPLPGENKIDVVIPVEDRRVVRYFLDNLVRKNSPLVRAALHGARAATSLGLMPRLVPYYYLIFTTGDRA